MTRELAHLLSEATPGPWRWDPGQEDDFEVPPVMWLTNADGDSLLVEVEDVVALLNAALEGIDVPRLSRAITALRQQDADFIGGLSGDSTAALIAAEYEVVRS